MAEEAQTTAGAEPTLTFGWCPREREHRRSGEYPGYASCQECHKMIKVILCYDPMCRPFHTPEEDQWQLMEAGCAGLSQLGCPHGAQRYREMQT